jgi:transcriptional regulator GlxA family with amidase domain
MCYKQLVIIGLCILSLGSCRDVQDEKEGRGQEKYNAAFLIMDGTFNSELTAPFDMFQHTQYRDVDKPISVFTVAKTPGPIRTFEGLTIQPDYWIGGELPEIDILVIPAADGHLDKDLKDERLINWIRTTGEECDYVLSLCDGAFPLVKTGLLDDMHCTTFPGDRQALRDMFPSVTVHDSVLWVHHGKFITSAGGAKSFEPAQYLIELLYGEEVAVANGKGMVIDWDKDDHPYLVFE